MHSIARFRTANDFNSNHKKPNILCQWNAWHCCFFPFSPVCLSVFLLSDSLLPSMGWLVVLVLLLYLRSSPTVFQCFIFYFVLIILSPFFFLVSFPKTYFIRRFQNRYKLWNTQWLIRVYGLSYMEHIHTMHVRLQYMSRILISQHNSKQQHHTIFIGTGVFPFLPLYLLGVV